MERINQPYHSDLSAINKEMASIVSKDDLIHFISITLKRYLQFSQSAIFRYHQKEVICTPYIYNFESSITGIPDFQLLAGGELNISADRFDDTNSIVILDVTDILPAGNSNTKLEPDEHDRGLVLVKLFEANKLIGFLVLLAETSANFSADNASILKQISFQIAIVTANIIAKEEILRKEEETNVLLALSSKIAAIRNRAELLQLVSSEIKFLFDIEEFALTQIDENGETYRAFMVEVSETKKNHQGYPNMISTQHYVTDPFFSAVVKTDAIVIEPGKLLSQPDMPPYVRYWASLGIERLLFITLHAGGKTVGTASFYMDGNPKINDSNALLRGFCSQLGVAMSNVLAHERIQERDEEKTKLLALSVEIAALKTRQDLYLVVNNKIKKLLNVNEFGIAQVDEGGETYSAFFLDFLQETEDTPGFRKVTSGKYSVNDPIFTKVQAAEEPILFDVEESLKLPISPSYVKFWHDAKQKFYLHVPLRVGGVMIGFLSIHFPSKEAANNKVTILRGLRAQLAVGISNIMANEKIMARDREKNLLLSLSNEIATVASRTELVKVVNEKIKKLFGIKQLGLSKIDEGGKTYSVFLVDVDEMMNSHPDFSRMISTNFDTRDLIFQEVIDSPDPILHHVADLLKRPDKPDFVDFLAEAGIDRIVTAALTVGGVTIGTAQFIIEKNTEFDVKSTLLKGVCSQLAVAMSNILASEKIHEREVEKSKLLEFSNAVALVHDKLAFLKLINRKLKNIFFFSHAMIACINEDKETCITFILEPEGEYPGEWDYSKVKVANIPVKNRVFEQAGKHGVLLDIEKLVESGHQLDFIHRSVEIECLEMLLVPLKESNSVIGFFMLFYKEKNVFDKNQWNILSGVSDQLSIAAANIVANEKIQKHLSEIEKYRAQLEEEKIYLKEEIETTQNYSEIIGESPLLKKVFYMITQVASSDSTVLLLGETGTGKELIARAIHNASPRKNRLMVKINCPALPPNLIETE